MSCFLNTYFFINLSHMKKIQFLLHLELIIPLFENTYLILFPCINLIPLCLCVSSHKPKDMLKTPKMNHIKKLLTLIFHFLTIILQIPLIHTVPLILHIFHLSMNFSLEDQLELLNLLHSYKIIITTYLKLQFTTLILLSLKYFYKVSYIFFYVLS